VAGASRRASRPSTRHLRQESREEPVGLDIEIDEDAGSVRVFDPRAFRTDRRAFCRRLIDAMATQPGFGKAEVDLLSSTCRIEFDPRSSTPRAMAEAFSSAVRQAAADHVRSKRNGWWSPGGWSAMTAYRVNGHISIWETVEVKPGRIRLRHRGLPSDRPRLSHLADSLAGLDGVTGCRVHPWSRALTIEFRQESPLAIEPVDAVEQVLEDLKAVPAMRPALGAPAANDAPVPLAMSIERLLYLALAGGAFAATLVALVVPGIPTVPCLLATSYFLARSSPGLNERLRRTTFFGPILNEWERERGLSWSSKEKLLTLTGAIIALTAILTPLSPVALALILVVSSLSIYGIARLPAVSTERAEYLPGSNGAEYSAHPASE
jgi:uncharacterized membrane protein YbaN (DUF454 family)